MKSTIFVVEGQTEQIFLTKFIQSLAVLKAFHIQLVKYHDSEIIKLHSLGPPLEDATHYIQILNVENDNKVLSYIEDNLESFIDKGYIAVYGLRDQFTRDKKCLPVNPEAIDRRTKFLSDRYGITVDITVAVQEIEAWFLATPTFFGNYHEDLTIEKINQIMGFDLNLIDPQTLENPASIINKILETVGMEYKKKLSDAYKVTEHLDYEKLYLEKKNSISPLNKTVGHLDTALA